MAELPHNMTDLYLAPVVLALDARIEELGALDPKSLADTVAREADFPDFTAELRAEGLLRAVAYLIDLHDWKLAWVPRGLQLSHKGHTLVLGIPQVFTEYVAPTTRSTAAV